MLADSLSLLNGSTAATLTGGTALVLNKQTLGQYIAGTNDEPVLLRVNSRYTPGLKSQHTIAMTRNRNVAPISGIPQADDVFGASIMFKVPSAFTVANVRGDFATLVDLLMNSDRLDRILRGEL